MADTTLKTAEHIDSEDESLIMDQDLTTEVGRLPQGKLYLTINGIMHLADSLGLSITKIVRAHTEDEWAYEVRATNRDGEHRWGAATESKKRKFSKPMALNKAQRNAFNNFLRKHQKVEEAITNFNSTRQPAAPPPQNRAAPPPVQNPPPAISEIDMAKADVVKTLKENLTSLAEQDISEMSFWNCVRENFSVENSSELTLDNWKEIATSLKQSPRPDWIRKTE